MTSNELAPRSGQTEGHVYPSTFSPEFSDRASQASRRLTRERRPLLTAWAEATTVRPDLLDDPRWWAILADIQLGRSLAEWTSDSEFDPWDLPAWTPGRFLDALDFTVEDEEGGDSSNVWLGEGGEW